MLGKTVQRNFIPGSEWVYYKIYCGVQTADEILVQHLHPLINKMLDGKIISQWFFIRYADPQSHFRVRFLLTDKNHFPVVVQKISTALEQLLNESSVWAIELSTYKREVERYGANTIAPTETLFFYDSEQIISLLSQNNNDEQRLHFGFDFIEQLLEILDWDSKEKIDFIARQREAFKKEFDADKRLVQLLDKKYRKLKPMLTSGLGKGATLKYKQNRENYMTGIQQLKTRRDMGIPFKNYIASIIHMHINRLFRSRQRLYEFMLYDYIFKASRVKLYAHNTF